MGLTGRFASVLAIVQLAACAEPATFEPNPKAAITGGGTGAFKDSPRFRIYGATEADAEKGLKLLESAYECIVGVMGWRSSGLSFNDKSDAGPYYKMNAFQVANPQAIGGAAGVMGSDRTTGAAFVKVVKGNLGVPNVIVHEYGHALTYYEKTWVEMGNTGTWWETVANFVADTYMTAPFCAKQREKYGQREGKTNIDLNKIVGRAHQVVVDGTQGTGNYYEAWPLLAYITYNPDKYPGLGFTAMRDMFRKYKARSNETPYHALERVATPTPLATVMGRYWARMAYVDIGHKQAQDRFKAVRSRINYANVNSAGAGSYKVKAERAPRYFGASIVPLKGTGKISVKVTAPGAFTATLSVKEGETYRYVELQAGAGSADVAAGGEATLVVANTPKSLILFDAFKIPAAANQGLMWEAQITGATA